MNSEFHIYSISNTAVKFDDKDYLNAEFLNGILTLGTTLAARNITARR